MAELLVMTMNHGMDKLTQEKVDKMTPVGGFITYVVV